MSSIYVSEPATSGKVILKTTVGEIEIELWSKEAPKACRNFVQLCMEGYYNDTAFHRLVRGFIVQGGDPTGTGEGGESIYGEPFKTEVHSRLSFNRRGLVGMACLAENMNTSQFFFTLGPAPELTGKHTLFGRVAGDTLFNMLRLGEGDVGSGERPRRIHRIVSTTVLLNPYDDIVPRQIQRSKSKSDDDKEAKKVTVAATKNFSLLSFGEEAEEEELVDNVVSEKLRKKGKSAHDLLSDPRLSSRPVNLDLSADPELARSVLEASREAQERRRLREAADSDDDPETAKAKRIAALRQEAEELRREIIRSKRLEAQRRDQMKAEQDRTAREAQEKQDAEDAALARLKAMEEAGETAEKTTEKPLVADPDTFSADLAMYRAKTKQTKKSEVIANSFFHTFVAFHQAFALRFMQGSDREAATMKLLDRFSSRLRSIIGSGDADDNEKKTVTMDSWMTARLVSEEPAPARQVLDPSVPHPDRYDLYDPRNPLNVRKRGGEPESAGRGSTATVGAKKAR
ncbi:Peptidyl-prolyl cis-trans isomerase SDCCAG10 [Fasciola hepatica]|uniref:Spliceosome-associated protein CWC27 homolog n=1 Tax=Fasciola hepatica TaxID=6192 RepID=A0A4E0QYC2_FASHE|nr:Peptidyl-prolyl cis-trans isomerase SDCCAG10 [Fasciola hepatica]